MGGRFIRYLQRNNPTHDELLIEFRDQQNSCGGIRGYSGSLAEKSYLQILDSEVFENEEAAEDALNNNSKFDPAWAIPYKAEVQIPKANKLKGIEALDKANQGYEEAKSKMVIAIRSAKSKTVSCRKCKHRVDRNKVTKVNCPVCDIIVDGILSATQTKVIVTKRKKIADAKDKLHALRAETKAAQGINYIVGGWCSD
ncbi:hypothetical protein [Vibrio sp. R78045]|uniref:hypothetical protein n=1 Tax=Vibrio sp. R78045 TaxID=3093868 RepID=UPI0036F1E733